MFDTFKFIGFEASNHLTSYANRTLGRVLDLSPYDASAIASVERAPGGFVCRLKIRSQSGCFGGEILCGDVTEGVSRLAGRVCQELTRWKENRFLEELPVSAFLDRGALLRTA